MIAYIIKCIVSIWYLFSLLKWLSCLFNFIYKKCILEYLIVRVCVVAVNGISRIFKWILYANLDRYFNRGIVITINQISLLYQNTDLITRNYSRRRLLLNSYLGRLMKTGQKKVFSNFLDNHCLGKNKDWILTKKSEHLGDRNRKNFSHM